MLFHIFSFVKLVIFLGSFAAMQEDEPPSLSVVLEERPFVSDVVSVSQDQTLPEKFLLEVPFTMQAPFSDWGMPYQEACEEASLIMASRYFRGETKISKESADAEIKRVVAWEKTYFGFYESTDTLQTAEMARQYFDLAAKVIYDVTIVNIKQELLEGRLVLVPATGRTLGNPYFRGEGPLYHMLVIRGWNEKNFITNDPGIGKGEGYQYPYQTVLASAHDWNGGNITEGKSMVISVWRN